MTRALSPFLNRAPLLLLLCIALLAACGPEGHSETLTIGASAPAFSLKNVDEAVVSLADYSDCHVVCIVFTCNHCPFAKAYEDRLIQLQKAYDKDDVQFILINPNDPTIKPEDSFPNMQKRAAEKHYPFPYLIDETQDIAKAYGAFRTPEVYLFDAGRKLVYHGLIDNSTEEKEVQEDKRYLKLAIDHLLAGTPEQIDPKDTKAFGCTIKWKK
ncbi:thioredoxin family protein [bacterium]|nr:thioredoxin family protein [bacterium]